MPPTQLLSTLASFRRRIKLLSVTFGLGITVAALIALLLATILLDYTLNLPPIPRLILIVVSLAGVGSAFFTYIIQPAVSRLTLSDIAGHLESAFPQFDDRLRSTVAILGGNVPGSDVMKQRVLTETGTLAANTNFNRALVLRPVYHSLAVAVLAIAACMLAMYSSPVHTKIAIARLVHPFEFNPWPKRVQISIPNALPTRVPAGQRIPVHIALSKGDRSSMKPIVYYQYDDGPVQQEYMPREGSAASFIASLDAKVDPAKPAGTLKIHVKAGDDEYSFPAIAVVPRLAIRQVQAMITPPAYTKLPAQTYNLSSGPALATFGSGVALKVSFNKPLAAGSKIELVPAGEGAKAPQATWDSDLGRFTANESMHFRLRGTDADGFNNTALEEYEILVRPDQLPMVQIENPRRNEERTAIAAIPLQAMAEDDYAIRTMSLEILRLGDTRHWSIPLITEGAPANNAVAWSPLESTAEQHRFRSNWLWDLAKLTDANLKGGDVLEYHLIASDNFTLNGQVHPPVTSSHLRITIVTQEELAARLTELLRNIAGQLGEVARTHGRTSDETSALAGDTKKKPKLDEADRAAAERLTTQQSNVASATKQLGGKLSDLLTQMEENKSTAKELRDITGDARDLLDNAAEHPMREAVNSLADARDPNKTTDQRNKDFEQTTASQKDATGALRRALDRMGNLGNLREAVETIRSLLKDQQGLTAKTTADGKSILGKKPEYLDDDERAKSDKNSGDQKSLAERTEKALKDLEKMAESMAKSDSISAEAMKSAAQTGQQQQVSASQSRASAAIQQNQQAQSQQSQKQAEAGLQAMLDKLREAEKRKLAELAEKLASLQQQVANLVRRQSGHNLDNVTVQNKKIDEKTLADLRTLSERKPDAPAPQMPELSPAQEQTERNTRDIAASAEDLPSASEVASALTRAAGKMERAIVSLRATKLVDAYEPPQVDALAILTEAKKRVDELKNEIDKQLNQNQKETLRQAYVLIRQDQEKVNKETTRIDGSPQHYKREDQIRLNQLVTQEGGLSEKVGSLEEDLKTLGGTVYVWSNRDLVTGMNGVKDQLAKPLTGAPTQGEQHRILDQLDAMIASLDVKPLTREFEARSAGGGGGVCKKKLPTEAELRLLKSLQTAINKSTKAQDKPDHDKPAVLSLGTRQGELRNLLDSLLQKGSNGQLKLGPEPDPKDRLPDEAKPEDLANQETDQSLLTDKDEQATKQVDKETGQVGDRMARSRQRLALDNDPGKVTQLIQDKILGDLDVLIEQARKQECQPGTGKQKPQMAQGQKPREIGNQQAQAQNQGSKPGQRSAAGRSPAQNSNAAGPPLTSTDVSQDIRSTMKEWGGLTPRQRDAIIEGAGDTIIEKYKPLIDDYYRSLATKATEK